MEKQKIRWNKDGARVAVTGATGAVGREMLGCIKNLGLPVRSLHLLASERSAGKILDWNGEPYVVENAHTFDFGKADIALFSAGAAVSRELAPKVLEAGALMIDNTSAFRRDPQWPLVVPEINGDLIKLESGIIANPNCSTIQMVLALKAIHETAGLKRVRVATYQSCSGAGQKGIDALIDETRQALDGQRPAKSAVHARGIAFDVVPQIGAFSESGYTEEEEKMMFETRKILDLPDLPVSATCVRVPVIRSHSEVVHVVTQKSWEINEIIDAMVQIPGLKVTDRNDIANYATATQAEGQYDTFVSRIRRDMAEENGLIFWIVSDNLLKGAALNAVQIACAAWNRGKDGNA